jgi:hypothetical protein
MLNLARFEGDGDGIRRVAVLAVKNQLHFGRLRTSVVQGDFPVRQFVASDQRSIERPGKLQSDVGLRSRRRKASPVAFDFLAFSIRTADGQPAENNKQGERLPHGNPPEQEAHMQTMPAGPRG